MVGNKKLDYFLLFPILILRPQCLSAYFEIFSHFLAIGCNLMLGALVQAFHATDGEDCLQRWSWKHAVHLCHLWSFSFTFVSEVVVNIVIFVNIFSCHVI